MSNQYLSYAGMYIDLEASEDVLEGIANQVEPFFQFRNDNVGSLVLNLKVQLTEPPEHIAKTIKTKGKEVVVDTSLYAHLASKGSRWNIENGYIVCIDLTNTLFHFHAKTATVILYQQRQEHAILDAVRAIKSFFTASVEQSGGVQLHAAAVRHEEQATIIMGDMWQGKTTLLLELLSEFEVDQLSCDTTVLLASQNGQLRAYGWPSPFSVSHGTMADHQPLAPWFPKERRGIPYETLWNEGKKAILTSQNVVSAFNRRLVPSADRVSTCIFVHFAPDLPTQIQRIFEIVSLTECLRTVYLGSRDPIYHDWHGYLPTGNELIDQNIDAVACNLLDQCEFFEMWWAPSASSLMKRIPSLAAAHPYLREIIAD
ncbi:MAG: hypothetical protein KME42_08375 [Tildeniella nuda ZEHNDER 1965/U140]|jgi:hypothetical protein|nr:hypothetical protein [Tildeniella nuda ZEHNDER 1965/U140]